MNLVFAPLRNTGNLVITSLAMTGRIAIFCGQAVYQLFTGRRSRQLLPQCVFVGVESLPIVLLTAFFYRSGAGATDLYWFE